MMAAPLEDIHKTDQVGIDISMGIGQRITHPGLRSQVDHRIKGVLSKELFHRGTVSQITLNKSKVIFICQMFKAIFLK